MNKIMYDLFLEYVNDMAKIKNNNSYYPMKNIKYAVIMACHCDTITKLELIKNNLQYFDYLNVDKIIINTSELDLGNKLSETCSRFLNTLYYEIPNSSYYDFGKWVYVLRNIVNANVYDYIVLTNDSFIINSSINHFLNLTSIHNVELYGYNDSTQTRYHYQSYLFSLRKDAVKIFIDNVMDKNVTIISQEDVINNFEVKMTDWFVSKKCFLSIGNFKLHKYKNIFFTNDELYEPLKSSNLLPFIKLKRIIQDKHKEECFKISTPNIKVMNTSNKNNNKNNSNNNKNNNKNNSNNNSNNNKNNNKNNTSQGMNVNTTTRYKNKSVNVNNSKIVISNSNSNSNNSNNSNNDKNKITFRKFMLINSRNKSNKLF